MTKKKILIYTDSRGQHTPRNQPVHPVFAERLARREDVDATVVLCPMKWTTTMDFLDFFDRHGAADYDKIIVQLGIVDWSPRHQGSAITELYDNQSPNNIGNDALNTREYARKVVNNKKASFDAVFGAEAMQAHLSTPLGVEFEGQPTVNMYSLAMAREHLLPRLVALDKLIFITTNRFVPGWQGDYTRGRPANIAISESYAEAVRDALGPDRIVDLLKWSDAEIMQYTCDNIHLTKRGSDYVYDELCDLMNLPVSSTVADLDTPHALLLPKAPVPQTQEQQNAMRHKVGLPEGQPLATLIIGVRFVDGDKLRVRNLQTLLGQIDQVYGSLFDVLIVEQDRLSKFKSQQIELPASARHEFLYNPFDFNRGWGYNVAVKSYCNTNVVALLDTDVLLGDNFLEEILACHDQYKVISPYQQVYFTTEAEAEQLRSNVGSPADFSPLNRDTGVNKPTTISGGVVIMQRQLYLELGGFEQYTSYGGEDRALDVALLAVCAPAEIRVAPVCYVHLFHPPADNNTGALRAILAHLDQNYGCRVDRTLGATDYIHRNCAHIDKTAVARLVAQRAASFGDADLYQFGHTLTINGVREALRDGDTRTNAIFPPEFSNLHDYEAKELYKAPAPDSDKLASLYNKFRGQRCFIIGNGPSLNNHDLKLLENEYTFAVNSIFYKTEESGFRPTFFVVEDNMVMRDNVEKIREYQAPYKFFPTNYKSLHPPGDNTYFFRMNRGFYEKSSPYYCVPRFSTDASSILYCGQSVTYINLQLAYFMGFTEVHLIGMDFDYVIPPEHKQKGDLILSTGDDPNHFHKDYFGAGKTWKDPKLDRVGMNYREAKVVYEAVGRKIYNSTIGGKLEIFERSDFNALFSDQGSRTRPDAAMTTFPEGDIVFDADADASHLVLPTKPAIERLYNVYKGRRCFIVLNGAALGKDDVALLADEFTFGADSIGTGAEGSSLVPTFLVIEDVQTLKANLDRINGLKAPYNFFPIEAKGLVDDSDDAFYVNVDREFDVKSSLNYRVPRFSTDASKRVFSGHQAFLIASQLAFFLGFTEIYVIGAQDSAKLTDQGTSDYEQARVAFEAVGRKVYDASSGAITDALEPIDFAGLFVDRPPTDARQIVDAARKNALPPGSGAATAATLEPVVPAYAPFGNWLKQRSPRSFAALRSLRRIGSTINRTSIAAKMRTRSPGLFRLCRLAVRAFGREKRRLLLAAAVLILGVAAAVLPLMSQPSWDQRFWLWLLSAVTALAAAGLAVEVLAREALRTLDARLSAEKKHLVAQDQAIHQRLEGEIKAVRAELELRVQESTVEVASPLRAISKIWFHDPTMPSGVEIEHGHALLMKTMAAREVQSPGTLRGKTLTEIGTTREHMLSQGSTGKLAIFTGLLGMNFTTVDMDPANTKAAASFISYLNPEARALTAKGEDYLAAHEGRLDYVYLDAFDFYHDRHSIERQSRYREFLGTDINDAACWEMHRLCADAVIAKMEPGGLVALDDTWTGADGSYAGKGKLAVPLLLQHDFGIVAASQTTIVLERRAGGDSIR